METLKAVFCFETGIEDEEYLSNMADYFINSKQIHNFLDEELLIPVSKQNTAFRVSIYSIFFISATKSL
jgi:hypothetical protein